MVEQLADLIRHRLPITAVPSLPELRLHLAGPGSGLRQMLDDLDSVAPPYWAHVWGGGLVLARYLLDHPAIVAGRRVVDLGTGSGLVAIAAARAGACSVVAVDVDAAAIAAARLNAALNAVTLTLRCVDLLDGPAPDADLVLVGDLFYDARLARRVSAFLDRCTAGGVTVLVGDPGRAALPLAQLDPLHVAVTPDFGTGRSSGTSTVFSYRGS